METELTESEPSLPTLPSPVKSKARDCMYTVNILIPFQTTEADFEEVRVRANLLENRFDGFGTVCRRARTSWNHRADGELMFLDRHNVRCRSNEFIKSFVLTRRSDYEQAMVRYVYQCCRYTL